MSRGIRSSRPIAWVLWAGMVLAVAPAQAQTVDWVSQFGSAAHDIGYAVTTDTSGNIYAGGVTRGVLPTQSSAGNGDAFIARYDVAGDLVWIRQFGTAGEDGILASATDLAGNVYAAGFIRGATSVAGTSGLLAKYDSAGNQLWLRELAEAGSSTSLLDVDTDPAGHAYVLGRTGNVFGQAAFLSKYSAAGAELWSIRIADPLEPTRLAADTFGHIYVVGRSIRDAFVAQYDHLGSQVWVRQFGTGSLDTAQDVATNAAGDVFVVGLQDGYDLEASFLARYDAAGTLHWLRSFVADTFAPWAMAVTADGEGNAFVGGFVWGSFAGEATAGHFDAFVLQYDRAGTQRWVRLFGTPAADDVRGVALDPAGSIYLAGTTHGAFPGETHRGAGDAFLARVTLPQQGGIADRIADVRAALATMAIADGTRRSLDSKLAAAARAAEAGNIGATCGPLRAFADEVAAQSGKKLTGAQATVLRNALDPLLSAALCTGD